MSDTSITVSDVVPAPVERVFALLADPDRHPDLDASGMVLRSTTHLALTEVGDVFGMEMHNDLMGHYTVENTVVVLEPDRAIGWAPAQPGHDAPGHTFLWRLTPLGDDRTEVTQTYDWSAVTDAALLPHLPVVSAADLHESVRRLAETLE